MITASRISSFLERSKYASERIEIKDGLSYEVGITSTDTNLFEIKVNYFFGESLVKSFNERIDNLNSDAGYIDDIISEEGKLKLVEFSKEFMKEYSNKVIEVSNEAESAKYFFYPSHQSKETNVTKFGRMRLIKYAVPDMSKIYKSQEGLQNIESENRG